jgi:hypothetical protein
MRSCKTLFASILLLATSSSLVLGACDVAGLDGKDDGTWLVSLNGSWQPMDRLNAALSDGRPRDLNFAYVARDPDLSIYRRGILVIKTGIRAAVAKGGDRVTLAREAYQRVERCESYPPFPGGSVRGRSYDDYHDYSYSADQPDQGLLTSFHVTYAGRAQGCKDSNDDNSDSYFTGRWQSNRSQFSFDESVVVKGQHSQFLAQFGATPAYASTVSARKVEMKRYTADRNGFACVTFTASVGPGSFIRINDLERRIGLLRADEQRWEWPR